MDCVKLYFKSVLIGILTYDTRKSCYVFVKNKFFNNQYIHEIIGINNNQEVYYSNNLFSFFFTFLKKYGEKEYQDEYQELLRVANLDFDKNQFWIGV